MVGGVGIGDVCVDAPLRLGAVDAAMVPFAVEHTLRGMIDAKLRWVRLAADGWVGLAELICSLARVSTRDP